MNIAHRIWWYLLINIPDFDYLYLLKILEQKLHRLALYMVLELNLLKPDTVSSFYDTVKLLA